MRSSREIQCLNFSQAVIFNYLQLLRSNNYCSTYLLFEFKTENQSRLNCHNKPVAILDAIFEEGKANYRGMIFIDF